MRQLSATDPSTFEGTSGHDKKKGASDLKTTTNWFWFHVRV